MECQQTNIISIMSQQIFFFQHQGTGYKYERSSTVIGNASYRGSDPYCSLGGDTTLKGHTKEVRTAIKHSSAQSDWRGEL